MTCAQCAQRFASMGISLRHSVHFFVLGSAGAFFERAMSMFMGFTTKKNTALATNKNEINAFIKCPYEKTLPFMVNDKLPKSGTRAIAAISGVSKSETNALTMVPNAAPTTTPTARSTTFPLNKNCLKSLSINLFYLVLIVSNIMFSAIQIKKQYEK